MKRITVPAVLCLLLAACAGKPPLQDDPNHIDRSINRTRGTPTVDGPCNCPEPEGWISPTGGAH